MRSNAGRSSSASLCALRLLPRERRRRVEQLDAAQVVIAVAAHELVEDVEAVEAALSTVQPNALQKSKM